MKNKLCLLVLGTMFLMACASSQQRSKEKIDSNKNYSDTTGVDTVKRDTSSTTEQKPIRNPKL